MSFTGGGIGGDAGLDRGGNRGGGANRKNSKKFGKNLNKLTKAPVAPPISVVSSGGESSGSFRGQSSSRNGLLLLSTKSKSGSAVGGGGLLAAPGTAKTAHGSLLLSAGGKDGDFTKKISAHAWGARGGKEKETASTVDRGPNTLTDAWAGSSNSEFTLNREDNSLQRKILSSDHWTEQVSSLENRAEEKAAIPEQRDNFAGGQRPSTDRWIMGDATENVAKLSMKSSHIEKEGNKDAQSGWRFSSRDIPQASEEADFHETKSDETTHKSLESAKDYQAEYMSKLAKERAEKLRLEEEARVVAQKERAAMRLRVLEEKRLEERKRLLSIQSQERRELSKPSSQIILEPLGKAKKDNPASFPLRLTTKTQQVENTEDRKSSSDPDRSFSSLLGGKAVKGNSSNSAELLQGSAKLFPLHDPEISSVSADNVSDNSPKPVHMVQLSNLDELDRGGRGAGQGGQRMLFDPNSGSMVVVPSREETNSTKKTKQKAPPKGHVKMPDMKIVVESSDSKLVRGKQGKGGSRKDELLSLQHRNKKLLDKGKQTTRKRVPRTRGILYKIDKSGNYHTVDESEPDEGFGAHLVPGGKIETPGAHELLVKQQELKNAGSQPTNRTSTTEGFSFRDDPGFLQHQTNFEAQQQKILEDAWASLVENDEPMVVETNEVAEQDLPASKSGDDEYAAVLEISQSIIGLNFDAIDTMESDMLHPSIKLGRHQVEPIAPTTKFALDATSRIGTAQPANPFISPLGGVPGASLWGASTNPGVASSTAFDLSNLTGWNPTPFGEPDTSTLGGTVDLLGSTAQSSKLHLWGSSALDDN